ncbi:hypothetical protein [Flectobacillus major]|jgi:hypothetical protein|uniref:hypothetical protein n=1 Tax=Flectobacillus major TaxID=103 RepID=UPI0003FD10BE|nr:hypothetical protein [Flectobacillus major]
MNIQLIQGDFSSSDALELITQMVQLKIKYHENAITKDDTEETIKYSESKIKRLQQELFELRNSIKANRKKVTVKAIIHIG